MRVVIQRVSEAKVEIDGKIVGSIKRGAMILLGIEHEDSSEDIDYLVQKTSNLRIFDHENGVMNLSLKDINGQVLVISQFTLHASTRKGNRPSYIKAAPAKIANGLYEEFKSKIGVAINKKVECGVFGADMQCSLTNDGPVTIIIDSKNRE
ncbi:MAG: D-aminoacyl-tRNA deacylase [Rikenellaceae bacterium]